MSTPTVDYANVPLPEVRVMTNRLLSAETTEKILNDIDVIPNRSAAAPPRDLPTITLSAR